ncbi:MULTISPECIES: glucose-1-phosphate adenylyltransferase subunit GlgD [unclassified Granulicatella]|uniref:glucose-1-phosphate adenylyltransferase subunit GlgD n=1 Tax=unclassified Granulicatella TaxID=2630493 RepID=UPI0010748A5A|nr:MULTISPECIES: glucose-1-phosphate adenylyltransferase subunit GlgD [unclassified Granulicatella]MBF0780626.1 glucose-1-phosphate adenylyltransferase subunit GlgD [Granulicatella sp. 19428wC4_WM01]TFU94584.1 glucose-1-phosphate adenylyltransferase subunit GlgD [Granulicatella sp. WM01]
MKKNDICAVITLTEISASLEPLTMKRPIGALPFASRFRIIDFNLSSLGAAGVKSVGLFIGKSGRSIYDHVRSGNPWGFESHINGGIFTFSQQFYKYSLGEARGYDDFYEDLIELVKRSHVGYVFISGSKTIANIDLNDVKAFHIREKCDITEMIDENGRKLNKYLLPTSKLYELIYRAVDEKVYVEVADLVRYYLNQEQVSQYVHHGYTAIISHVNDYFQANMDMLDPVKFKSLFYDTNPVVTKGRNGAPTFFTQDSKVVNSLIATDCVIRGHVNKGVISRRVHIDEDAQVNHAVVLQGCHIAKGAIVEYAILDKGVQVGEHAIIRGTQDNIKIVTKNEIVSAHEQR